MTPSRDRPALLAFFLPLMRRTCAELGIGDSAVGEGARAYARVTALSEGRPRPERAPYAELTARFEHYAGALDYLRKVRFPGLGGPDPVAAFVREIDGVLSGLSPN
jgi:hypothetical protein